MQKIDDATVIDVLKRCTVSGFVVKLPDEKLSKDLYDRVKRALNMADGFWKGGKIAGFVFEEDPKPILQRLIDGEKINIKQEYQFFASPDSLGDRMVELAEIKPLEEVCEPSAGDGALVRAIHRKHPQMKVYCYELMDKNRGKLKRLPNVQIDDMNDFLKSKISFDKFIANPPFAKFQDIDHIMHMYKLLFEGGRIVTVSSPSWKESKVKKAVAFRKFLEQNNAKTYDLPAGTFKESGTSIPAILLVIDKPQVW